jgi:hypothetical protein
MLSQPGHIFPGLIQVVAVGSVRSGKRAWACWSTKGDEDAELYELAGGSATLVFRGQALWPANQFLSHLDRVFKGAAWSAFGCQDFFGTLFDYSARKAVAGSLRIARRAGI